MVTKKTLSQILRQATFSGADAGKAKIINWIALRTKGTAPLTENELDQMVNSIINAKQYETYKAYDLLASYLNDFKNMASGYLQQYFHAKTAIIKNLQEIRHQQQNYNAYLKLPLIMTQKDYKKLEAEALEAHNSQRICILEFLEKKTIELLEAYQKGKPTPEPIKAILDDYSKQTLAININNATLPPQESTEAEREAEKAQTLKAFAKKYDLENTPEAIGKFLASSIVRLVGAGASHTLKGRTRDINRLVAQIEVFEDVNRAECLFKDKPYIEVFPQAPTEPDYKKINKLEALEAVCYSGFKYYIKEYDIRPAEAEINDFKELFYAIRDYYSSELKSLKPAPAKSQAPTLRTVSKAYSELVENYISDTELKKAGLDKPLTEAEKKEIVRNYYCKQAPTNREQTIRKIKAHRGGIAVLQAKGITSGDDPNLLDFYINFPSYDFLQKNKEPEATGQYIENLLKPALCAIFGINAILDVYSEIFKVDLSPLKTPDNFKADMADYNSILYLTYEQISHVESDKKRENRETFKKLFQPIDVTYYRPRPELIAETIAELEKLPLKMTINLKYFQTFLKGAGVKYE